MSLLAKATNRRRASGSSGPGALRRRRFTASYQVRLQSFKEATATGELPEGTVWLVRIIEAGQSLNGPIYTEEALKAAVPVFEGVAVRNYAWSEDPSADDAGHLPDAIQALDARGLTGNQIGSLEGVHYNEQAKALDGFLKVYDTKFRERMLAAFKLGDIGEGGDRDVFGFSIDAIGDQDEAGNVIRITSANELTAVSDPAAGGRVRRLVAAVDLKEAITVSRDVDGEGHCYFVKDNGTKIAGPFPDTAAGKAEADARAEREREKKQEGLDEALEETVKSNLTERLAKVVLKEATALEDKARFSMLMRAVDDEFWELSHGDKAGLPMADKVSAVQALANDLVTALGSGGMQESFTDEVLKENVATLAGQLKLWADQLSTASDEDAPELLKSIQDAIKKTLDEVSDATPEGEGESQEADMTKPNEAGAAAATQDDFARMSAGLEGITEALKTGDAVALREAAVAAIGAEPQLDPKDKEIQALKEKLKGQAIEAAMVKLTEELRLVDPKTTLTLIDRTGLTFDAEFKEVNGLKEAIKEAVKDRPYLVNPETPAAPAAAPEGTVPAAAAAPAAAATPAPRDPASLADAARQTEANAMQALTPQQAAQAVLVKAGEAAAPATPAPVAVPAAAPAPAAAAPAAPAAAATPAIPAPAALGQDVALRESVTPGARQPSQASMNQLKRFRKQMLSGNVKAMKKHRDLSAQLGL